MENQTKFIFVNKQTLPSIEKCEDTSFTSKQRADEFFLKVVSKCPSAEYVTNVLGIQVVITISDDELNELNAEQLAQQLNCSIYKKIAG